MRLAAVFLVATTLSIATPAAAQVSVTSPAAGKESSYRKTTISWAPIPGATSYHLEIDDDPNFGSPEVDVTVAGTSYALSGERLKLNGQLSWAAYVRINGKRWNANTFTPSYFDWARTPALGVNSQNEVFLAFQEDPAAIQVASSNDWSSLSRLSLAAANQAYEPNFDVDEHDVAHASWTEYRFDGGFCAVLRDVVHRLDSRAYSRNDRLLPAGFHDNGWRPGQSVQRHVRQWH